MSVQGLGLSKWQMLFAVVVFYVILGCFMETLSMMITTIPVIAPVMQAMGFDMIWFGIVVIVLVETALITPPVGLNLFVVHNLRKSGSMNDVIAGSAALRAGDVRAAAGAGAVPGPGPVAAFGAELMRMVDAPSSPPPRRRPISDFKW